MADEDSLDARLTELEHKQSGTDSKLDELLALIKGDRDKMHEESTQVVESRLDRSSMIQEHVRAELARKDKEKADQATQDENESLKAQLAKLTETQPEPPQPRRERWLIGPRR